MTRLLTLVALAFDREQDEEIDYDSITTVLFEKKAGVSIRERSFNLRKTSQALSGQDMIISLVQHTTLNRDDAMRLCQELLVREYIKPTPNRDQPSPPVFYDKPSCMYKRRSGRCLNTHRVYSGPKVTDPLGLSIELLNKLLALYSEYQTLILRFGSEALANIQSSPEFQTFRDSTTALQSVSLDPLSDAERLAFFYNIYNTLMLHSCVANHKLIDSWSTLKKRLSAWKEISYSIGANRYSLLLIELGMIRANMKPPESPVAAAVRLTIAPLSTRVIDTVSHHTPHTHTHTHTDGSQADARRRSVQVPYRVAASLVVLCAVLLHGLLAGHRRLYGRQHRHVSQRQCHGVLPFASALVSPFGPEEGAPSDSDANSTSRSHLCCAAGGPPQAAIHVFARLWRHAARHVGVSSNIHGREYDDPLRNSSTFTHSLTHLNAINNRNAAGSGIPRSAELGRDHHFQRLQRMETRLNTTSPSAHTNSYRCLLHTGAGS